MGPDASKSASQPQQYNHQRHSPMEGQHRQEALRCGRVRHLLRYCQQQRPASEEGLQDLQEEIPRKLHNEMVCEEQQELVSTLQVAVFVIYV